MVKTERQCSPTDFVDDPIGIASTPPIEHIGDPCIHCGTSHDEVAVGDCSGKFCKSALLPCPFCDENVERRFSAMTGRYYFTHIDWNSSCPLAPFYGTVDEWNDRKVEKRISSELDSLRKVMASKNDQIRMLIEQVREVSVRADQALESARNAGELRDELFKWMHSANVATDLINEQQAEIEVLKAAQRAAVARIDEVLCERDALQERLADNRALILVQHKHLIDASRLYQKAHNWNTEQYPDIGELLRWLMDDVRGAMEGM